MKPLFIAAALTASLSASAADVDISVQNLTQGIYFTPLLITAHPDSASLYTAGEAASAELQAMAEGGDISGLKAIVDSINADSVENPAMGLLAPGASTMTNLMTSTDNTVLSIVGMILPTNDGFVGLRNWTIPDEPGTYHIYLNAYDAGTEANDERVTGGGAPGAAGIPAAPGMDAGQNGTGVTDMEANQTVHIHRGNLGDDDANAGKSDLDNRVHRWLNPVAKVTVTVK